ncbi:MAG: WG repeat-containing protein, partial [Cyclobacteriaceae bacterium]|nr:WG repeat-containing protein [Cyclobacteriaceae bacterium]
MRIGNYSLGKLSLILLATIIFRIQTYAGGGEEYSIIEKDHKKGLVNKKGRVLIPVEHDDLGWTNGGTKLLENVIGFKKDGLWGILNTKNEKVTEPVYTSLTRFSENWIVASKKLPYNSSIVYGVINAKGNAEIAFQFHGLRIHNNQLIASIHENENYLYGILNDKAKPVISIKYDRIEIIADNLYEVTSNELVAVFNSDGDNLTDFSLDSIQALENNYVLTFQNGKRGLIANDGGFIVQPQYKDIRIENGNVKAQKFHEWHA